MIKVNAMGDACPIPVVKTKNAIKELGREGGCVTTYVDNEIAVQNLTKMAVQKGYGVKSEKLGENKYQVTMQIGAGNIQAGAGNIQAGVGNIQAGAGNTQAGAGNIQAGAGNIQVGAGNTQAGTGEDQRAQTCLPDARKKNTVVVISSSVMGTGDDQLGASLMKGFIYALSRQDELPATILFYNGGARITGTPSPSIEDLKSLEAEGVEILTCGTCLNYYGLTDQLQVGTVTNMYTIVEKMSQASLIIKP